MANVGERLAAVEAILSESDKYNHDRWHKLNNDLQPLINLPGQMARDMGKLEGKLDSKIAAFADKMEQRVEEAIARALGPVNDELSELKRDHEHHRDHHDGRLTELEKFMHQWTTIRVVIISTIQIAASVAVAVAAVLGLTGKIHL